MVSLVQGFYEAEGQMEPHNTNPSSEILLPTTFAIHYVQGRRLLSSKYICGEVLVTNPPRCSMNLIHSTRGQKQIVSS